MVQYTNFYETMKEAVIRLHNTVISYEGQGHYVLGLGTHDDGIFRLYLEPLSATMLTQSGGVPQFMFEHEVGSVKYTKAMDDWVDKNPAKGIIRKKMNSPMFNKFRPFPLGMLNYQGTVVYTERQPQRHTQQGLMQDHVAYSFPRLVEDAKPTIRVSHSIFSEEFARMIRGDYPTPAKCVEELSSKDVMNQGAAFHREFCFLKGPVNLLFLTYKKDIIGYLPNRTLDYVSLSDESWHLKEKVAELNAFGDIVNG